jgi:hypothetical protein
MATYKPWIATTLLPLSAVALGRLVEDITNPERNFQDTSFSAERPECPEPMVSEARAGPFLGAMSDSESNGLSSLLMALLGSTLNLQQEELHVVSAEACTTQTLSNSTGYFSKASKSSLVRDWLEQVWRKRKKAYVVVGIKLVRNAKVTLTLAKSRTVGFQVKVPGSLVMLAATSGSLSTLGGVENLLDSEISTSHGKDASLANSFVMPGENIIAVQYRRVNFSRFRNPSSGEVDLRDEIPWKVYLGRRGGEDTDEGSDAGGEGGEDVVYLRTEIGGHVQPDDVGAFNKHEDFAVDGGNEIWYIC